MVWPRPVAGRLRFLAGAAAAYFSIGGLVELFQAQATAVAVWEGLLEVTKLVMAGWLARQVGAGLGILRDRRQPQPERNGAGGAGAPVRAVPPLRPERLGLARGLCSILRGRLRLSQRDRRRSNYQAPDSPLMGQHEACVLARSGRSQVQLISSEER